MNDQIDILKWRKRNRYYYQAIERIYRFMVRPGSRVLHIGCECGDLLAAVEPEFGMGVDQSPDCIEAARDRFAHLQFETYSGRLPDIQNQFDYILICNSIGKWDDVQEILEQAQVFCHEDTRIIITYYNYLWEGALKLGSKLGLRRPCPYQNWLEKGDIENLLMLCDYDVIRSSSHMLMPFYVPAVSWAANNLLAPLPVIRTLNLINLVVARPKMKPVDPAAVSVSVVVPCRNERGNIEDAVRRIPDMGRETEILFVDGSSTDGTVQEIERIMAAYGQRDIKLIHQGNGRGKGDAVRKGFAQARGDLLVIQDADLTAPPEDLPKFFRAWCGRKGEFINGSRLVYPMEKEAMRFLNYLGNKFFGLLFSWLLSQRFRDTLCGTKMISRKHYDLIARNRAFFGEFDPFGDFDLIFGAIKQNLKVVEVPVRYRSRSYGDTNISRFRHGFLLLKMSLLAYRKIKWM